MHAVRNLYKFDRNGFIVNLLTLSNVFILFIQISISK